MAFRAGNIIEKIIRLVWDKSAARTAEGDADRSGRRMEATFNRIGKALVSAFAIRKIIDFTAESVRMAAESERSWNRLGRTVEQAGVKFKGVERQIRLAAASLQDTAAIGDDEFADALQTLIRLTGNFDLALRNVPLAADIAFGANMDLNSAAELLGRTLNGNLRGLNQLGINAKNSAEAIKQLQERYGGLNQEGQTLTGQLKNVNSALGDIRKEFGGLIGDILKATGALDLMKNAARGAVGSISDLRLGLKDILEKEGRGAFVASLLSPGGIITATMRGSQLRRNAPANPLAEAGFPGGPTVLPGLNVVVDKDAARKAAEAAREAAEAARKRLDALIKAAEINRITLAEEKELLRIEVALNAELAKGISNVERRLEVVERLAEISQARGALAGARAQIPSVTPKLAPIGGLQLPVIREPPRDALATQLRTQLGHYEEFYNNQMELAQMAADFQTEAFAQFFGSMIQGFQAGHDAAQIFADGVVGLGRFVVAQLIEGFAQREMAMGMAALAAGTFPPNPLAWKAASLHFLAAGLFKALGAAVGSAGRGGGGSMRPATGSLAATQRAGQTEARPDEIHIHFMGGFRGLAQSSDFQYAVTTAQEFGKEKLGSNTRTIIHTGGR